MEPLQIPNQLDTSGFDSREFWFQGYQLLDTPTPTSLWLSPGVALQLMQRLTSDMALVHDDAYKSIVHDQWHGMGDEFWKWLEVLVSWHQTAANWTCDHAFDGLCAFICLYLFIWIYNIYICLYFILPHIFSPYLFWCHCEWDTFDSAPWP